MVSERVDKHIKLFYFGLIAFFIGFILYIGVSFSTTTYARFEKNTSIGTIDWACEGDDNSVILSTTVSNFVPPGYCIGFYTSHTNIHIYANDTLIYTYETGDNAFGNTPGCGYHIIQQIYLYYGQTLKIMLDSPYKIDIPTINFATENTLVLNEISKCIIPFSMGVLTSLVGLIFIVYGVLSRIKHGAFGSFIFLGFFAINIGLYSCNEQNIFLFIIDNHVVSAYLSFVLLMFLPISLALFSKSLYKDSRHIGWYICIFLNVINLITCTVLQIFDITTYKNCLTFTHIIYGISLAIFLYLTIREIIKYKLQPLIKVNIACLFIVTFFVTVDLILYYNGLTIRYGNTGFLFYIVVIGRYYMKTNSSLIEKGKKAEQYLTLAYQDNLTGIGNRTAHAAFLEQADVTKHSYIIGMFDLNNLKYYNDNFGHEIGDTYIKTSAQFIKDSFSSICDNSYYRIGGDEFCVILEDKTSEQFEASNDKLQNLIKEFNAASTELKINIAVGYALFDASIDHDLKETRSRADALMYENKFIMKQKSPINK